MIYKEGENITNIININNNNNFFIYNIYYKVLFFSIKY